MSPADNIYFRSWGGSCFLWFLSVLDLHDSNYYSSFALCCCVRTVRDWFLYYRVMMIHIDKMTFGYKRSHQLFKELNLDLTEGSIVGLLGRNGEGKTTLLKLISGQLLRRGGELRVNGHNPQDREVSFLNQIFLLPEEVVCPSISVQDYFSIITPFYPNYSQEIAEELIKEFDLNWRMNLGKLSQGQKKKAVIALALSLRVPILLMDEPTNALDIPSKSAFRRLVARYMSEGQTLIISTHQVRDLEQLIDHLVLMDGNQIVCNESIDKLSERFLFLPTTEGNPENLLYKEGSILGKVGVFSNPMGEEQSGFSMELFFNAMISEREQMLRILAQQNVNTHLNA